jgi:hypothetical protein
MPVWQFFDYYPDGGGCPISDWYEAQTVPVRAVFAATVEDLGNTEDWSDPDLLSFDVLVQKPEHAGLSQVKFYVIEGRTKKHYRALGRWREEAHEFIFLTGLQKSGRVTIPHNAFDEAIRLLRELEQGRGEIHEHDMEEAEGQTLP